MIGRYLVNYYIPMVITSLNIYGVFSPSFHLFRTWHRSDSVSENSGSESWDPLRGASRDVVHSTPGEAAAGGREDQPGARPWNGEWTQGPVTGVSFCWVTAGEKNDRMEQDLGSVWFSDILQNKNSWSVDVCFLYLVGALEHFLFFHSVGNNDPNWRSHIFFRGVGIPPTSYGCFIGRYPLVNCYITMENHHF